MPSSVTARWRARPTPSCTTTASKPSGRASPPLPGLPGGNDGRPHAAHAANAATPNAIRIDLTLSPPALSPTHLTRGTGRFLKGRGISPPEGAGDKLSSKSLAGRAVREPPLRATSARHSERRTPWRRPTIDGTRKTTLREATGATMGFLEHLDELRTRLIRACLAIGAGMVVSFALSREDRRDRAVVGAGVAAARHGADLHEAGRRIRLLPRSVADGRRRAGRAVRRVAGVAVHRAGTLRQRAAAGGAVRAAGGRPVRSPARPSATTCCSPA